MIRYEPRVSREHNQEMKTMNNPIRHIRPFSVRLNADLREYLENQAYENRLSLNAEIARRLRESRERDEATEGKR